MIEKEKTDLRLSCIYAATNVMREKRPRSTTKDILNEAKKI